MTDDDNPAADYVGTNLASVGQRLTQSTKMPDPLRTGRNFDEYVERVTQAAPPLSPEQRDRITQLFRDQPEIAADYVADYDLDVLAEVIENA